jgi:5-methylcytosine-specific restriction endonuclease McrA
MQEYWTDFRGKRWRVITSGRRLKYRTPAQQALRVHVFHEDGYACRACGAKAENVPADYDGTYVLFTNTRCASGWPDMLIVDHVLTLKAGGTSRVENLQTLCDTCNKRKTKHDRAMTAEYLKRCGA